MARPVWGSSFLTYSINSVTSEATNYPSTRLITPLPHPVIRRWRSTSTVQQNIICDFGSSQSVAGVILLGANFQSVTMASSPDNVTYTNLPGTATNIGQDTIDGYYKWFLAAGVNARYMRVRIPPIGSNLIFDGASYYTLGSALFVSSVSVWPRDLPAPRDVTLSRTYLQSGTDILPAGPFYITQEMPTTLAPSEISSIQTMALLNESTPFFFYRNMGNVSQVYLFRYTGGMSYSRFSQHYTANPKFVELV